MTWLAPLALAGLLAIAAPVLFHLWRRTPRGVQPFPTLMFLSPSPPRVTSRSRVEYWLLLLIRAAALALLAFAFARPVWRTPQAAVVAGEDVELVAILVDTSASLRRTELWPQTLKIVEQRLSELPNTAIPALFHTDDRWVTDVSFRESAQLPSAARAALIRERLQQLSPSWRGTDLGQGLVQTAHAVEEAQSQRTIPCSQRICVISDFAIGTNLNALKAFDWPAELPVELLPVAPLTSENAGLQLVATPQDTGDQTLRIRISNAASSTRQSFPLVWGDREQTPCLNVAVPPGQSRVFSLPQPPTLEAGASVTLTGDEEPFDNQLWLPHRQPRAGTVLFLGPSTASNTEGPRFYLERALPSNPSYDITIIDGSEPLLSDRPPELVVATDAVPLAEELLPKLIAAGTQVLLVPTSGQAGQSLLQLCGVTGLGLQDVESRDYALWSQIDFESPWFAPFAEAQFADFSGIHFWRHRRIQGELPAGSQVWVRFDDNAPAVIRWPLAKTQKFAWLLTSGWHPADSQLARSSKFVPLMWRMLEEVLSEDSTSAEQKVGEPLKISSAWQQLEIKLPDDSVRSWKIGDKLEGLTETPGRYELQHSTGMDVLAVNLPSDECRTDDLPLEMLEATGVVLSTTSSRPSTQQPAVAAAQQQLRDMEQRQQLWWWGLLIAGSLLIVETVVASRRLWLATSEVENARVRTSSAEAVPH